MVRNLYSLQQVLCKRERLAETHMTHVTKQNKLFPRKVYGISFEIKNRKMRGRAKY
jgi:hypothetical protein